MSIYRAVARIHQSEARKAEVTKRFCDIFIELNGRRQPQNGTTDTWIDVLNQSI